MYKRVGVTHLSVKERKMKSKKKEIISTRTFTELSVYERKGGTHLSVKERKKEKVEKRRPFVHGYSMNSPCRY